MTRLSRFGLVLSLLGGAVICFGVVLTFTRPSAMVIALLELFAACLLILGEQLRRGVIGINADATATASVVSRFRPLGLGWHALWSGLGLVYCLIVLGIPCVEALTVRIVPPFGSMLPMVGAWLLIGVFALAIEAASVASLYKKAHYLRLQARDGGRVRRADPRAAVWRFVTFRWRFDLWTAAIGGGILSLVFIAPTAADHRIPGDLELGLLLAAAALIVGGGVFTLALWMASNYWKAARPLGTAESYA